MVRFFAFLFSLVLTGCAASQIEVQSVHDFLMLGNKEQAAQALKEKASKEGDDQLFYLLNHGLALFEANQFKESIAVLLRADKMVDFNDYLSISNTAASLLMNEGMIQYKGDSFEKILINVYLALNYLNLGKLEDAAVEARRLNERLRFLQQAGEEDYNRSFLARYLSALIWEEMAHWDDAYIDFEKAYEIDSKPEFLKYDLKRAAYRAKRFDALRAYDKKWPQPEFDPKASKKQGEVVLLLEQGWIPQKVPSPQNPRMPMLAPRRAQAVAFKAIAKGQVQYSSLLFNVGDVALTTFNDQLTALALKRAAGLGVKAVVSDQLRQKNEALGFLAWILLNATDRADDRQWSLLPNSFQIIRMNLPPGSHEIDLMAVDEQGHPTGEKQTLAVVIKANAKVIRTWRAFR